MGCLKAIGCLLCLAVLGVAGVLAYRYGPWYDEPGSDTESPPPSTLTAANACDGCCNLLQSNCNRPVNEVLFPMVHNAHSSYDDLFVGYNNNRPLEEALVAGYRGLMLDSCICDGSLGETLQNWVKGEDRGENYLGFCHSSCDAGVRDPAKVLGNIKTFLDINKNEVLILEFEIRDNSLEQLFSAIDDSGLDEYIYRASSTDVEWPTLQSLIDSGARALLFAHGDGMESCNTINCPEGFMYTFDHFEQTEWNGEAAPSGCDIIGEEREAQAFFLMNHWKNSDRGLPSEDNAEVYNSYDVLMDRFRSCTERIPTILAVDFWGVGDVLSFAKEVNERNAGVGVTAGEKI